MRVIGRESMRGLGAYFASLVHESVRGDVLATARHQSFIASHLLGGLLALCVFPVYLVLAGKPSLVGALGFLWFLSPIAIAIFLSRTGKFAAAHFISAANFAGLVTYSAWLTGGVQSFLILWMAVVPLEGALSTERRVVAWSAAVACLGLIVLIAAGELGYVTTVTLPLSPALLACLGVMSATAYAAGLVITIQLVHRRSEQVARIGEERYRLLAENSTDMITRHDERGRVVFVSHAAQRLLGEAVSKLYGDGLFHRVHVADRPAYLTALSRSIADNEPIAVEFRLRRAGTTGQAGYVWVEMRCRPLATEGVQDGESSCPGLVAVTRDISERKAHEAELKRTRDEAESSSRAKSLFLANMSHELRTPLNAVIGFSEILNRELFGSLGEARYRDYARLIHESGEHLLNVVNDILDMSKIEAGSFKIVKEPFDVAPLVTSCCEIMRHTAEKKEIRLLIDVPPGLPELPADKRACKQMLLNVLSNAIKFTDPGGWVRVSARVEKDAIVLIVADNGIGIAEHDLPKLGTPFVQADNSYDRNYEGAGLGLSVVKGLARLHGGRLEIESQLGEGTKASITLPLDGGSESVEPEDTIVRVSAA
jgi:cell cycle sensor histidine kinase DivJ